MSNVDLTQQFEEDSPQQVNEIDNVQSLSNYVLQLQSLEDEVKVLEENLKRKKEAADKISEEVIPEIMESMKLKTLKLQDGSAIEVKEIYGASIPIAKRKKHLNGFEITTWVILLKMRLLFPLVVAKITRLTIMLALLRRMDFNRHKK